MLLERSLIVLQQQRDPVVISELLSCISALFVYVQKVNSGVYNQYHYLHFYLIVCICNAITS